VLDQQLEHVAVQMVDQFDSARLRHRSGL